MTNYIAAYVCLSRVKQLGSICVMQPFSTVLFAHGNLAGPERLVRQLSGQITAEQAIIEWSAAEDAEAESEKFDPMEQKHMCASCYLMEKKEYMHYVSNFGVTDGNEF